MNKPVGKGQYLGAYAPLDADRRRGATHAWRSANLQISVDTFSVRLANFGSTWTWEIFSGQIRQ